MRDSATSILGARSFGTGLRLPNRNLPGAHPWLKTGCGDQITWRVNGSTDIRKLLSGHSVDAFSFPALLLSFWSGIRPDSGGSHGA